MGNRPRRITFILIFCGLLLSWGGCTESTAVGRNFASDGTDSAYTTDDGPPSSDDSDFGASTDSESDEPAIADTATAGNDDDTDTDTDADTDTGTDTGFETDTVPVDTEPVCPPGAYPFQRTVQSPEDGAAVNRDEMCASPSPTPIVSNLAARVTLNAYSASTRLATGHISVAEEILPYVVGDPVITVVSAYPSELQEMTVTDIAADNTGFTFSASWPAEVDAVGYAPELRLRVNLTISCAEGSGGTKEITSLTYLYWCDGETPENWASSGDECTVCEYICEMAPSPIVPKDAGCDDPLCQVLRVEVVPVAIGERALCLVAEVKGGDGPLCFDWSASGGTLSDRDMGGVVWHLPEDDGLHQIQVAVTDRSSAGVSSYFFTHRA